MPAPTGYDLVSALTADRRVAVPLVDLAEAMAVEVDALGPALVDAKARDQAEVWDHPKLGRVVCMTPGLVEQFGWKASRTGKKWIPRRKREVNLPDIGWGRFLPVTNLCGRNDETSVNYFDQVVDARAIDPLTLLIRDEQAVLRSKGDVWPRVLLEGSGAWCPAREAGKPCPACGNQPLPRAWYCLRCDRPLGSMVYRALAQERRKTKAAKLKLKGGIDRRAG